MIGYSVDNEPIYLAKCVNCGNAVDMKEVLRIRGDICKVRGFVPLESLVTLDTINALGMLDRISGCCKCPDYHVDEAFFKT